MKKKIVSLALAVCLLAIAAVGTLAYFTDKDAETNTFTMGNVSIDLQEKFDKDNAKLLPGSQTSNNIQKEVTIKNDGSEDAYVFYTWMIPAALDSVDGSTGTNNVVHVNSYGATWDKYYTNAKYAEKAAEFGVDSIDKTWDHTKYGTEGFIGTKTVDDILYNVYVVLYHGILKADEVTTPGMSQVYLDSKVDNTVDAQGNTVYTINGDVIDYDFTKGVNIIVNAYGIQANGFADVYAAYEAYVGQNGALVD